MRAKSNRLLLIAASVAIASCTGGNVQKEDDSASEQFAAPLDASGTLAALQKAGLPITDVIPLTAETDDNKLLGRPNQYTSKADFIDSRYPGEEGLEQISTVEVFANEEDAVARQKYVEEVTKAAPFLTQYIFREGSTVLRLDKALSPDHAKEYGAALANLKR